jgi:MFS family permease
VNANRVIAAAILLVTLVGLSLSLFIPLLSLEMERRGISATLSGINTAMAGIGTIAAVPFVPRLAARFGVPRLLMFALVTSAVAGTLFPLMPFEAWFPLRFLFGALLGMLFTLSEFWITAAAPPERRGFVMGLYATSLSAGFATGPLILAGLGTTGLAPYLAGAALYLAALAPLMLAHGVTPALDGDSTPPVFRTVVAVPVATFAALTFGAIETGGFALLPVYGLRIGHGEVFATALVSLVAAGNIVSQVPLGLLSDRLDRRKLLLGIALAGAAGAFALPLAAGNAWMFGALLFVWGGVTGGLYTVGLAHLGSRFSGADLVSANAAFVMLYSVGLILGPPLVGVGMDGIGPHGFSVALGCMLAAYGALVAVRLTSRG